ncbi:MAG: hypothetical protein J5822_02145 [Eubacteriaceae bacterium]|nr:hypothetical protein [Eubacteriaceae bacterium]
MKRKLCIAVTVMCILFMTSCAKSFGSDELDASGICGVLDGTYAEGTFISDGEIEIASAETLPAGFSLPEDWCIVEFFSETNVSWDREYVFRNATSYGIKPGDEGFPEKGAVVFVFRYIGEKQAYRSAGGTQCTGSREFARTYVYLPGTGQVWRGKDFSGAALKDEYTKKSVSDFTNEVDISRIYKYYKGMVGKK